MQPISDTPEFRFHLETEVLPRWLPSCRWFAGKARAIATIRVTESVPVGYARIFAVQVDHQSGDPETYVVPLTYDIGEASAAAAVGRDQKQRPIFDAGASEDFRSAVFAMLRNPEEFTAFETQRSDLAAKLFPTSQTPPSRVLHVEQSNTAFVYGDLMFVKLYRKRMEGLHPDAELTRFLSERAHFPAVPAFGGSVNWRGAALLLAVSVVPNQGDAWKLALEEADAFYQRVASAEISADLHHLIDPAWLARASLLGQRTAEMHVALCSDAQDEAFLPESFSAEDGKALREEVEQRLHQLQSSLQALPDTISSQSSASAPTGGFIQKLPEVLETIRALANQSLPVNSIKIRTHGDYHLGQVLCAGPDFVILDFEGEPARSLSYRRAKRSPLRDVSGMERSFDYAAHVALGERKKDVEPWRTAADGWTTASQKAFRSGWESVAQQSPILVPVVAASGVLGPLFRLEKALYEADYELNNRPAWIEIPLRAVLAEAAALRT